MALTKPAKAVLCVFAVPVAVWIAASLYFTIAGCDTSGDCICEYLPAPQNLAPEENAYTAIKEFAENIPSNGTPLMRDYKLRNAYLDDTTNRLALAEEVRVKRHDVKVKSIGSCEEIEPPGTVPLEDAAFIQFAAAERDGAAVVYAKLCHGDRAALCGHGRAVRDVHAVAQRAEESALYDELGVVVDVHPLG